MTKLLPLPWLFTAIMAVALAPVAWGQCENPTIDLPDASTPVNGNPATAYCVTFTFDPDETGLPIGLSMELFHTWQGDLSIFVNACGNTLNIMQRPGVTGSCTGGCPCGNSNDIGTAGSPAPLVFLDGGGPDPEGGIPIGGGTFGITSDLSCPVGTPGITSFVDLWAACPPGPITSQVCIGDHAGSDEGVAQNVSFVFPDGSSAICGCTDPTAINYDPNATVDDGSCIPPCATFEVSAEPTVQVCSGGSVSLSVDVQGAFAPDYTWTGTNGGDAFLSDNGVANPVVTIPDGVTGSFTYVVVVNDPPCMGSATVTVNILNPPTPQIIGEDVVCQGEITQLAVTGGVFIDYAWSTGENGPSIQAGPGDYSVTVQGINGCLGEAMFTVLETDPPIADIFGPDEICPGGVATLTATPGFAAYDWSSGDIGPIATVFNPGAYTVTVTDLDGCTGIASFFLPPGPGPDAFIEGNTEFCDGASTTLQGPPGMAIYSWSTGQNTPTIQVNATGTYTLFILDANNCPAEATVFVTELPAPIPEITGELTFCEGAQTSLSVTDPFVSYQWSTGATGPSTAVVNSGVVSVTVTDADGCVGQASISVSELNNPAPTITGPQGVCDGDIATLTASAGFPDYNWSTGEGTPNITADVAGIYQVTVTDAFGCSGTAVYELDPLPTPIPNITGPSAICPGATGVLDAGPGFAQYAWTGGGSTQQISVTTPGLYRVTVTNIEGCTGEDSFVLDQFTAPQPQISGDLVLCPSETTTLQTTVPFGVYSWSTGATTPTISVNTPGNYRVTVTNGNGCTGTASVNVTGVAAPQPTIAGDPDFCQGQSSTLSSGAAFSSYVWSTGATTSSISVNAAGPYSLTVTDANGCTGVATANVTVYDLPTVEITGGLTFCPNGATILSGTPGFASYLWTNGATTPTVQINTEGSIGLTVTDQNGCADSDNVVVDQQDQLTPVVVGDLSFCSGLSTTLGVVGNYTTYVWSNGVSQSSTTVSVSGPVTVTVTDAFGCTGSTTVNLTALPLPQPPIQGELEYCRNESTTLMSGNTYVNYLWSTGDTTASTSVSAPGTVGLTVTDSNGCVGSGAVNVAENALPQPVISGIPGFCPGEETTLSGPGGFAAYSWSTGSANNSISVGVSDDYSLVVTDGNGCQGSTSISVAEYAVTDPVITGDLGFCPGASTTLSASAGFETYEWSNGVQNAQLTVSAPGSVSVVVTDVNGCATSATATTSVFTVTPPVITGLAGFCTNSTATLTATPGYNLYVWSAAGGIDNQLTTADGGIYSVEATDANGCISEGLYELEEYDLPTPQIGGSLTYCIGTSTTLNAGAAYVAYSWSNGSQASTSVVNAPGNVGLTVTDSNGCEGSSSVNVIEATELSPVITGQLDYCAGGSTLLDAGTGYTTYLWSDGSTGQTLLVTSPGTYTLNVADATGCEGDAQVAVIENPLPTPQIGGLPEFCVGGSTSLQATPGYESYDWSTGAFTPNIAVNMPGTYSVQVEDANGCVNTTQVVVAERPLPVFTIQGDGYFCAGSTTSLAVSPAYTAYNWSNAQSSQTISISQAGSYTVTVTNEFGCEAVQTRPVQRISLPTADAGSPLILNCNITSVSLGGGGTSQGAQYSYLWSGPGIVPGTETQFQPVVSEEGTYVLVVTNEQYGCESLPDEVNVANLTNNPAVVLEVLDVIDCNTATVVIDGTQSASGPEIVYQWYNSNNQVIPGAQDNTLETGNPNLFYLQVLDTVTGCANIAAIQVTEDVDYPIAEAGIGARLDCRQTSVQLNASASQDGPTITYNWYTPTGLIQTGQSTTIPVVGAPGWYFIEVTDQANGCRNIDSVLITRNVEAPIALAGPDQELNCLIEGLTLNGEGSSVGAIFTYQWLLNGVPLNGATSIDWYTEQSGPFTLVVTNQDNGCESRDNVLVARDEAEPVGLAVLSDTPTCFGDTDGSLTVAGVEGGTPPFIYSLNGRPFDPNTFFTGLGAGTYTVTVQDATGCEYAAEVVVDEANDLGIELGPDQNLDLGDMALVNAEVTVPAEELTDIKWQTVIDLPCDTCLTHELLLTESVQFFVRVVDENGCVAEDLVTVFVRKEHNVYIPSAFSPNGDGTNDVFMVFSRPGVVGKINSFLIFNRWGEVMYEVYDAPANDPLYGWNGMHRGREMNAGAYVWTAEVTYIDGVVEFYKGEVILMR